MQERQGREEDRAAVMGGMILLLLSATLAVCVLLAALATVRKVIGL